MRQRSLMLLLLLLGVLAQGVRTAMVWPEVRDNASGRDFASYYYAVEVAAQGDNPYDMDAADALAREEHTRGEVHPFFYPPPFVAMMSWSAGMGLSTAYRAWFWLQPAFLLAALAGLWRLRPQDSTLAAFAAILALFTPIPNNGLMGQANVPVLAAMVWGYALAEDRRSGSQVAGGLLLSLAAMAKMSPGLLVLAWLVNRKWVPAFSAIAGALLLSLLSLPWVSLPHQLFFYTDVLPGFGSGDYHGLTVPITLFGNHSLPNLWAQVFPGRGSLSESARLASSLTNLVVVAGTLAALRGRGGLAPLGALSVLMVIVPVYGYEHHLVMVIPAMVALASELWAIFPGLVLSVELRLLKQAAKGALAWPLQEAKTAALIAIFVGCVLVARRVAPAEAPAVPGEPGLS